MPSSHERGDLLPRIADGDREAVGLAIERYGALVWSMVRGVLGDGDLAEDAAQEVFIDLWTKAARFDGSKSSEASFVALIARRRAIDVLRRRARRTRDVVSDAPDEVARTEEGFELVERDDEVRVANEVLAELRPEQQRVLALSLVEGLTHTEIAERTKMPLGTVKTHARRGLQKARELLAGRRLGGEA